MKKILSIGLMFMCMGLMTGCENAAPEELVKIDKKKTLNNILPDKGNQDKEGQGDYVDTETDLSDAIEKLAEKGNETAANIRDDEINNEIDNDLNKKLKEMGYNMSPDGEDSDIEPDDGHNINCSFTYGNMLVREWNGYHKLGNKVGKVPTRMSFSTNGNIKIYTKPFEIEDWSLMQDFNVDRMRVPTDDKDIDDIVKFPQAVNHCLSQGTCITLYPQGAPIQANSPFNVELCINAPGSITVNMLKHTFYLSN